MAGFIHICGVASLLLAHLGWLPLGVLDDWDVWDDSALHPVSWRHWIIFMTNNPHHTRNRNIQVPWKFLLANMFANILLAKSNYMVESRIRVGSTTKLQGRGCNSARLLTGAISTISLPPGFHSQGLWFCCHSLLPTILVLLRELLFWLPTLIVKFWAPSSHLPVGQ